MRTFPFTVQFLTEQSAPRFSAPSVSLGGSVWTSGSQGSLQILPSEWILGSSLQRVALIGGVPTGIYNFSVISV